MEQSRRASQRRVLYQLIAMLIVAAIYGWVAWEVLYAPSTRGTTSCCPPAPALALGAAVNESTGSTLVYAFAIESAGPIPLTDTLFQIRSGSGALMNLEGVCIAGPTGMVLGTWSGAWATSGQSTSCSSSATHPPGNAAMVAPGSIYVYPGPAVVGGVPSGSWFEVLYSGPYLGAVATEF